MHGLKDHKLNGVMLHVRGEKSLFVNCLDPFIISILQDQGFQSLDPNLYSLNSCNLN